MTEIEGRVEPGYAAVADAFADNFVHRGDTGAACAVYVRGELVVDVWAGSSARGPWSPDQRSCVFSVSKGVTTICLLMAVERGLIELDAPVWKYWPEYAVAGKEATTVRHLLNHQAGIPAPEHDLTAEDVHGWEPVVDALARQSPAWIPGTAYSYHALTFGWLTGEVLRRASGRRPSEWLRDEIVAPLTLKMSYGCDPAAADFCTMGEPLPSTDLVAAEQYAVALANPLVARAMSLGKFIDPTNLFSEANTQRWLGCEMPAGNLVTNARSLARLFAATVGDVDGVRLLEPATVRDAYTPQSFGPPFAGPDNGVRWGTGFMLPSPRDQMLGESSFGHEGAGGHLGFADLEGQVGFAYQTSRPGGIPDERANDICRALRACV